MLKRLAAFSVPGFILAIVVAAVLDVRGIYEPAWLLPTVNTVFLFVPGVVIAAVSVRGYLASGSFALLLFGGAATIYGTGSVIAGWLIALLGAVDVGIMLDNTGAAVGAALNVLSGLLLARERTASPGYFRRTVVLLYAGLGALLIGLTIAGLRGLTPMFVLPGGGFTPVREATLGIAVGGFAFSAVLFGTRYSGRRSEFLYWGTLALALLSIGLCGLLLQKAVGTLVGWLSRSAQYVGSAFFLIAVVRARRDAQGRKVPGAHTIASLFSEAKATFRALMETATDATVAIDQDGRILVWNTAAERIFGYRSEEALGASLGDITGLQPQFETWRRAHDAQAAQGEVVHLGSNLEAEVRRKNGQTFPAEFSVSKRRMPTGWVAMIILRDITERKRAEDDLRLERDKLEMASENLGAGLAIISRDYRTLWANRVLQGIFGNVVGQTCYEVYNKRSKVCPGCGVRQIFETESERAIHEQVGKDAEGKTIWSEIIATPIRDKVGNVIAALELVVPITDRKQAEETLQRYAERLQVLHEIDRAILAAQSPEAIAHGALGYLRQMISCQRLSVALFDVTACEIRVLATLSEGPSGIGSGSRFAMSSEEAVEVLADGGLYHIQDLHQHPTPTRTEALLWAEGIRTLLRVPLLVRGEPIGALTLGAATPGGFLPEQVEIAQQVAEQLAIAIENARLYEATVRQLKELKALYEMGQAVASSLRLDEQLGLLVERLSQAMGAQRVLVGLQDAEEAGCFRLSLAYDASKPDPWLHHLDLSWAQYPEIQEAMRTGRPLVIPEVVAEPLLAPVREHLESLNLRSMVVMPLIVQERAIGAISMGYVGQGRTFTDDEIRLLQSFTAQAAIAIEKARLYEAIQQHAAELEARVQERTHELEAANQQLQDASRHKSEFLANMSHEIRTPLNSIIGFAELLREQGVGPLNEKQARYITHVANGGKHLLQLIADILDLSKVEAGKFVLQPEPLPVGQTLEEILVIGRGLANKKGQEIRVEIAPDLPPLTADPVRFKQILFNLLSNAVKFTPDRGTITLAARKLGGEEARTLSGLPAEAWLEIRVTDTGAGIKPEDMPRLFHEFVQLETTQAQKHEGTGLGLALTKRLVELHGGRIWAKSEGEGRGSTFTVVLPFSGPGAPAEALAGARSS
jgi:PAS domain S-box-containing protein